MKLEDLITFARNQLITLNTQRVSALNSGNFDEVARIDKEITETQTTLQDITEK